jgi:hypothetical protein
MHRGTVLADRDGSRGKVLGPDGQVFTITSDVRGRHNGLGIVRGGGGGDIPEAGTQVLFEVPAYPLIEAGSPLVRCWAPTSEDR